GRGLWVADLAGVAAIGTVADLAPMTGESRAIVRAGLEELAASGRAGLRALLARSASDPAHPTARDLGFSIAPRINAAGRIAEAELALQLLVSNDPEEAARLADELDAVHVRRRELTGTALEEARALADGQAGDGTLLLRQDAWAPGLIGLVAGRLADQLARPVGVVCAVGEELRGSVRAPTDFHVAAALEAFDAVAFGAPAERQLPATGDAIDLVGTLERDSFQGIERLRLRVVDYAHSQASPLLARRLAGSTPAALELAAAG